LRPETELAAWDTIAGVVENLWGEPKFRHKLTRNRLIQAVVMVSTGTVDVPSQVSGITDKQVERIKIAFTQNTNH
jgi:hypothetical protein